MKKIDEITNEELRGLFVLRAALTEDAIRLNADSDRLFILDEYREIHMRPKTFFKVVERLQPVVTFNPNWGTENTHETSEAYFMLDLFAQQYKVFCIYNPEDEKR